ncbi:glycosyltransferase family 90 protein, partial [Schizophyllum amplum]
MSLRAPASQIRLSFHFCSNIIFSSSPHLQILRSLRLTSDFTPASFFIMALGFSGLKIRFGGGGNDDNMKSRADLEKGAAGTSFVEYNAARTRRFVSQNLSYIIIFSAVFIFVRIYTSRTLISLSTVPEEIVEVDPHPIPQLIADAQERFERKVARQSRTLEAAAAEYRRRYGRNPPKGFDKWWAFAKDNDFVMVDEFDGLVDDLEPFWEISGEELARRALQAIELPSIDLVSIRDGKWANIRKQGFEDTEEGARAHGFRVMLEKFAHELPDLVFPINAKAEGRIIIPWEHRAYPNMTTYDYSAGIESVLGGPFIPSWTGDGSVWNSWRRTCKPTDPARQIYSGTRNIFSPPPVDYLNTSKTAVELDLTFVSETPSKIDYCQQPQDHYSQGHFFSDWRVIPMLYPIFSPANTKGFYDIKIPSHYYYGGTKEYTYAWDQEHLEQKLVDDMEKPWDEKSDKIFWRGATTGGGGNPAGFSAQYQRHRFLRMTSDQSDAPRPVTFAHPSDSTNYTTASVPVSHLNAELMDAAFTKATNPGEYPGGLEALQATHRFADPVPLGAHWSYKYLVDLDGMSYSGRFMSFLASDSVPVKATLYREFFSEWIEPWVHFIPMSLNYSEIYNIHAYFSGAPQVALTALNETTTEEEEGALTAIQTRERRPTGDERLHRIAQEGKRWKNTIGRKVDME